MVNGNTASVDAARPPIMHQESNLSASSSSSLISNVNIRPSRTLVRSQQQSIGANSSSNADSCSNDNCSDMNSDSDSEQSNFKPHFFLVKKFFLFSCKNW